MVFLTNTCENLINRFFNFYYKVIDYCDATFGRKIAVAINILAPIIILQPIAFTPSLLLTAYNIQRISATAPLAIFGGLSFFSTLAGFNKANSNYQTDEIKRIINNSTCNTKKALIIETTDWRGGLPPPNVQERFILSLTGDIRAPSYRLNLLQLAKTHSIQHIAPHSELELYTKLEQVTDNTIDLLWIRAHGEEEYIYFNKNLIFFDKASIFKNLANKMKQFSKCILSSCSTGKGESNIAKSLSSSFPKTTVYAPKDNISTTFQNFSKNLSPIFYLGWFKNVATRSYYAGTELTSPVIDYS